MNYKKYVEIFQQMQDEPCQQKVLQDQGVDIQRLFQKEIKVHKVIVSYQNFRKKDLNNLDQLDLKQPHIILQKKEL